MDKILLFGGTFNPIHNGHLIVSRYVGDSLGINEIIIIPAGNPPCKKGVENSIHRKKMVINAIRESPSSLKLCDYELKKTEPSYSINTIKWAKKEYNKDFIDIFWLIGEDVLPELPLWYKIQDLITECQFVVVPRTRKVEELKNQWEQIKNTAPLLKELKLFFVQTPIIEISSTIIRERVKNGKSIHFFVPEGVRKYIQDNRLYQS